jgi:PTS system mannose-specific IIC component
MPEQKEIVTSSSKPEKEKENINKRIVGITACAAGIAHTYMAADSLKQTGEKLGYNVRIETQGATGAETVLTDEEINNADVVIVASDVKIDTSRFKGKRVLTAGVASAIKDPQALIQKAYSQAKVLGDEQNAKGNADSSKANTDMFATKKGKGPLTHIMTGIS